MSPFKLEISDHAAQRLKQRLITRDLVRQCVIKGQLVGFDIRGRVIREFLVGRRRLVVIYIEITLGVLVVTAYWRD